MLFYTVCSGTLQGTLINLAFVGAIFVPEPTGELWRITICAQAPPERLFLYFSEEFEAAAEYRRIVEFIAEAHDDPRA